MNRLSFQIEKSRLERALRFTGPTLVKFLRPAIGRTIVEMARNARRLAPKAMSTLVNSIIPVMAIDGLSGEVRPHANYAEAVERGTGLYGPKHTASGKPPPVAAILDWIKVKRIKPDDPFTDQEDLAYVISRSIAARGTPPQPYLEPAFLAGLPAGKLRIERAIAAALRAV